MTVGVDTVLLKVASRCNIDCRYCYVFNMGDQGWLRMPKQMSADTWEATARALGQLAASQGRPFSVVLHGGEPLLLGTDRLRALFEALRHALPPACPIGVQTNGVLLAHDILDACAAFEVTVAVSLDGPREVHDRYRTDARGAGTFDRVMRGIAAIRTHPAGSRLFTGLLAVVDPTSDARTVYEFFRGLRPPSVDFIYRDGNHSRLPDGKRAVHSTEYGEWMVALADAYLSDPDPVPIRILDDTLKLMLGGSGSKDGVGVTDYGILVIDTDGSVTKNDTLKSAFDGADRFAEPWSVHAHALADVVATPEFIAHHQQQRPSSPACAGCPELAVCGGGMPLHRWKDGAGFGNPSVYCADQRHLIGALRRRLHIIGVKA